jgi:sugar-specific transcriptional regulator TrmB
MNIKNESLVKKLEKTGFTDKEALVYVSLLELGGAYPSRVAEYCGLKRATTYNVLLTLSIRGVINEIEKKNKLYYQIEKPEKIVRYSQSQIRRAEDALESTKKIIPEIEDLFGALKNHPRVTYYEGNEGLLSIYEDMIDIKKPYEMLAFSKADEFISFLPKEFLKRFIEKKVEIGITTRGLTPDTPENRKYSETYFKNMPEKFWPKAKYIKLEQFPLNGEIVMYGDSKIAITNFNNGQMTGIVIDDKALHGMMRTIFELSWNSALVKE